MQLIRRFRIPALFCAFAVLICELISRPFAEMGISDDVPYILMARTLATTGHVVYNGWAAPMLTWQLYLAATLIKLFGFSFTTVRMSTVLVAVALAFVLQRTLVLANITERNATIGTLALVLSPLYLVLSVTFMSDITGLFAIVICLYGCLRALQSSTSRAVVGWLCFAVLTNALCGTSRQIAWLGILVMVPSTLWLLRAQRRVLVAGAAAILTGVVFIFACLHWLKHQPYSVPEHIIPPSFPIAHTVSQLTALFLDVPFLLLPVFAIFLPCIRKRRPLLIAALCILFFGFLFLAIYPSHLRGYVSGLIEPTMRGGGDWVSIHGIHEGHNLHGTPPIFLNWEVQALLTIASLGGLIGFILSLLHTRKSLHHAFVSTRTSWKQLGTLLVPFTIAYTLLLIPRATSFIYDRYLLPLLIVALICLIRYYQEQVHLRLPLTEILLVAAMAIYGIAVTHNQFSLYRARVALAAELRANGIPDTSVDNGFEYNFGVELQHASHINLEAIAVPAGAYVPTPPLPPGTCPMFWHDETPHIHPLFGVAFDPNACYGLAPFAPTHYSRWLAASPGTLYVVRYTPTARH